MNLLSYRISNENGLSFELLVDGEPLGQLVGSRDTEIPYWIVGADLPTLPPRSLDATTDIRIVTVCSCGEYGCGHTSCIVIRTDRSVFFCNFESNYAPAIGQKRFEFSLANYDGVVSEIVSIARERRENEFVGEMTVRELLAWADRLEAAANGPESVRRGLPPETLRNCAANIRNLAMRKASGEKFGQD